MPDLPLTQPTVSAQLRQLEATLGEKLFERKGRGLALTEVGRIVFRYADEIFGLGRELLDVLDDRPTGRSLQLCVGVSDAMPKMIVQALLAPALGLPEGLHLVVRDDKTDRLLAALSLRELDLVLADAPMAPDAGVKAFNHLLMESAVSVFAPGPLAARLRRGFPRSLARAPMLLPTRNTALRRSLDQWFDARDLRPRMTGEIEDSALLKALAPGIGAAFAAPTIVEREVCRQYQVRVAGRLDGVRERFYAISVERRLKHPAVVAISRSAHAGHP